MTQADARRVVEVVWEEPPPESRSRNKYDWENIAHQLRSRPNHWAKVFDDGPTSVVNAIRQRKVTHLDPAMGFQVRTRNNVRTPVRSCTLYMRYVPPGEEE